MRTRTKVVLAVGGSVLVLGGVAFAVGPGIYADHVNSQAAAPPRIAAAGERDPLPATDLPGEWTVGAGSFAGYRVDEVLRGHRATVTGRTEQVTGDLTVTGDQLTAADITVDVAGIATPEAARDAYFRSSVMDTDRFPQATFELTSPAPVSAVTGGRPGEVPVTGELTIHGVTRQVSTTLQAAANGDGAQVTGSVPITFADYGVTAPRLPFVSVEDTGQVEFSLHLERG
ncbi:YceI family protein [Modestobacter sp. NPDC049651]|uniref:YceI family protein n=1 Tax=unclassified Modestobacter TaxID=2643866 RepID=UPI0033DA035A